jgi:hypothetical protein
MNPTYYCSSWLTEKSGVYSFGVILIELLTRKTTITYRSSNDDGLVAQFLEPLDDCKWVEILDPRVVNEGGGQVEEVSTLAALCIKLRAGERPTMRQVEMTLEGFQAPKEHILHDLQA